jgi:ATP-dependent Clp protease ATP-binding subunit ClpA
MTIQEIAAKITKGETLTDEEKNFLGTYDPTKAINDAAAAARKKAEQDAKAAQEAAQKALAELEALKASADTGKTEAQKQLENLTKQINALTQENNATKERAAKIERANTLREKAKASGIVLADGLLSEKNFYNLLESHVGSVDLNDDDAVSAAFNTFKTENAGILKDPSKSSGTDVKGGEVGKSGKPLDKMTTEEIAKELDGKIKY